MWYNIPATLRLWILYASGGIEAPAIFALQTQMRNYIMNSEGIS
jgi:hypothetical protein